MSTGDTFSESSNDTDQNKFSLDEILFGDNGLDKLIQC